MRFLIIFGMIFTCFSHTCSNCVFAYFFLGRFSNVCTLSKHGIFKKHCFSRVKTLFSRIHLCRRNFRIFFFGDRIVSVFCLIFKFFDMFFCVVFRIAFLMHFLPKIGQNWPQNLVHLTSLFRPFSRLRFFVVFLLISGSLLAPLWHPLGSFWCPFGSNWVPFGAM